MLNKTIKFFLENKLVTALLTVALMAWGVATAPFNWDLDWMPRDPVPVDAIPDIGENQQIVYTEWMGKSPQDIEDQITYPLTTSLLGVPGVKTIRSSSLFGLSSIYIIFEEDVEFYWSRSRILEKLNSLPAGTLPADVQPALGPDATALGQVFWYTLEGRDPKTGEPTGGWDPQELRTIQDFYVKYSLSAAEGVSEVASIGGFVKEYQVEIDPTAMKSYGVNVKQIMEAVRESNLDVGARTIEFNRAEYLVRGLGYIESLEDLEEAVVAVNENTPIRLKDVARIQMGPATRRGGLDKGGAEATGAVVVARYGSNPLAVIDNVKKEIENIAPGLPSKTLADGTVSKVTIVPFYDRSGLIYETLGTLEEALILEILISIIVVIVLVLNLRAAIMISGLLPIGVLMTFIVMQYAGVDANIVALSGIAIAIGVMLDVGVIFTENILRHLELPDNKGRPILPVIYEGTVEIASAVLTALATTVISFIPVFAMTGQEGKLFGPLAFTKTFALIAAMFVGLVVIPALAHGLFSMNFGKKRTRRIWNFALIALGVLLLFKVAWVGIMFIALGLNNLLEPRWPEKKRKYPTYINIGIVLVGVLYFLNREWLPLGADQSEFTNLIFVGGIILIVLGLLMAMVKYYQPILRWALENKWKFLSLPIMIILFGLFSWQGFDKIFSPVATGFDKLGYNVRQTEVWLGISETFPGAGEEFMPPLEEGSFLLMPTTMPHSGVEENVETIRILDRRVTAIPEVDMTVGKWGRASTALDPAPISMFENVINYKSEYVLDQNGRRKRFEVNDEDQYVLKNGEVFDPETMEREDLDVSQLIGDPGGEYFRQWRDHIKSPDDIWDEIVGTTSLPGVTSAPKLQPIATRLIMLSTGMRAPMGMKIFGPDLETIEEVGLQMENILREVPGVKAPSVFADRVVGKPYMELEIDRRAIARYGLSIGDVQRIISAAVGGMSMTTTVEGRERYGVRLRYAREFRDNPEDVREILVPTPTGVQIPLGDLVEVQYVQGPQVIKSEDTFLLSYVIFDKEADVAEVDVVENAQALINEKIESGEFVVPPGVSYKFAGNYENQLRAAKTLSIVIPISLLAIFLLLYFQFGNFQTTLMAFSGVFVALSGGFILLWLYNQTWFLDFNLLGENMREVFQIGPINLSVAVWVGFIALFGVATDDGVLMGTYLKQVFAEEKTTDKNSIRRAVVMAGSKRVRPAVMTTATTLIALMPILTSTGKGSDIMIPMAIPTFGGMLFQTITMFVVPVLYSMWQEKKWSNPKLQEQQINELDK
ncbi:efflux RND transporter permease subunit [Salinimicrobium tongyeongense]|uniref:Cation transporter n=3 Tax=Flavobacteriaceae TaxID=49546 RepID=A0A918S5Z2_9FLAO|nr:MULTISPECIES: efflux RND transporter permease subunit [Flavobacteriaceae]MDT0691906.1 efflux RND transporter permease subunit [Salegentibacter sp. F188]UZH55809.1 efflux RND transporter permease subunit [Salinimicrobium tongyeongense]GHA25183.1 cation transporter [Salinimicrobium marinum]